MVAQQSYNTEGYDVVPVADGGHTSAGDFIKTELKDKLKTEPCGIHIIPTQRALQLRRDFSLTWKKAPNAKGIMEVCAICVAKMLQGQNICGSGAHPYRPDNIYL